MTSSRQRSLWWRLVTFGFRLLYNEFAWTYDLVSWAISLGHWRRWQRATIKHLWLDGTGRVLELAHGTADLQLDMLTANVDTIGLDLSPQMGRIAKRKLVRHSRTPRLLRASATSLPFSGQVFASVVSTFPTEFILNPETLREASRVLLPGGHFITVPNGMLTWNNSLVRLIEWLYRITGQRGPWPVDPVETLREAGFEAKMVIEKLEGSQVWILIARKTAGTQ